MTKMLVNKMMMMMMMYRSFAHYEKCKKLALDETCTVCRGSRSLNYFSKPKLFLSFTFKHYER